MSTECPLQQELTVSYEVWKVSSKDIKGLHKFERYCSSKLNVLKYCKYVFIPL